MYAENHLVNDYIKGKSHNSSAFSKVVCSASILRWSKKTMSYVTELPLEKKVLWS